MSRQYRPKVNKSTKKSRRIHLDKKYLPFIIIIGLIGAISLGTVLYLFAIGPPTQTPTTGDSTFIASDYLTDTNVSNKTIISILVPSNVSATEEWEPADWKNISNYELLVDSEYADTIAEDLSIYPAFYLKIHENITSITENYWLILNDYENFDFQFWVFKNADVVTGIMIDSSSLETIDFEDALNDTGIYTFLYIVDDPETEILCPTYDPTITAPRSVNLTEPLTWYTNYYSIQLIFNETIDLETNLNITIPEDILALVFVDTEGDDNIAYLVFYSMITFDWQPIQQITIDLEMDETIGLASIDFGMLEVSDATDLEAIIVSFSTLVA